MSKIILAVMFTLLATVFLTVYFTSYTITFSHFNVFENMTSSLFKKYNVSESLREQYSSAIVYPIENIVNLTFLLLFVTTILCLLVVLAETLLSVKRQVYL
ncbi:MAG: hypothetical protein ACPL3B_09035 [Fervidobacterium sp.]